MWRVTVKVMMNSSSEANYLQLGSRVLKWALEAFEKSYAKQSEAGDFLNLNYEKAKH